jgi:1,4-alpha-glucan branching enzyme
MEIISQKGGIIMPAVESVRKSSRAMKAKVAERYVEFTYYAPKAKKVYLAGKFNGWNTSSLPMKKGGDGNWFVKVMLPPGKHEYKYFVDNAWSENVSGVDMMPNAFGTANCVMDVK